MKLNRTDLVRAAMAKLREDIEQELKDSAAAVLAARRDFESRMRAEVLENRRAFIGAVCDACGTSMGRMVVDVLLTLDDQTLAEPPIAIPVVLRDDELYAARVVLHLREMVHEPTLLAWVAAEKRARAAAARDTRAKALGDDARAEAVNALLEGTETGRKCLALLAELAKQVDP